MLKSKKHNSEKQWREAYFGIRNIISKGEIDQKLYKAIQRVRTETKGLKTVWCWSGGKDAQALRVVCEMAGLTDCVMGAPAKELEYPTFNKFVEEKAPKGLHIIRTKIDLEYLNRNPEMLFPTEMKYDDKWADIYIRKPWYDYCKDNGAEVIILGNRTQDGNICGKNGVYYKGKLKKVCPLYDFTHEEIFALLTYYNMELPPQYMYKDGFKYGSHPWAKRTAMYTKDKEITMWELMEIDPMLIPTYANKLQLLGDFCDKHGIKYNKGE